VWGSPRREQGERVVDQLSLMRGGRSGVERGVLADHGIGAPKTGLNLVRQPPFDASDIIVVKDLGG